MMKKIDEYIFIELLGKGGFGEVYLSINEFNPKFYSIKKIDRKIADSPYYQKFLNDEIKILKEINHINIIHYVTTRITKNNVYIITDYYNGGTLSNCLEKYKTRFGKAFSEEIVQYLMRQIVEAIKYLHGKRIVHRDIKLDNILINFENVIDMINLNMLKAQIKLIDFGFAIHLNDSNKLYSILGTKPNMDPIIVKKFFLHSKNNINALSIPYNEKIDIFSLGTVCYEMLVGRTLFNAENFDELMEKVENGNFHVPTNLSKEVVSFLNEMLQYDYRIRLSADELSKHPFLTKSVKDFQHMNLAEISHKVDYEGLLVNIKKHLSILSIPNPIQEQNNNLQNPWPNNIVNKTANDYINNNLNNNNNYNLPYELQHYANNNIQYGIGAINANANNNYNIPHEQHHYANNNIQYGIGALNPNANNINNYNLPNQQQYIVNDIGALNANANNNNLYWNIQKPKYYKVNLNEKKNVNNYLNPKIYPKPINQKGNNIYQVPENIQHQPYLQNRYNYAPQPQLQKNNNQKIAYVPKVTKKPQLNISYQNQENLNHLHPQMNLNKNINNTYKQNNQAQYPNIIPGNNDNYVVQNRLDAITAPTTNTEEFKDDKITKNKVVDNKGNVFYYLEEDQTTTDNNKTPVEQRTPHFLPSLSTSSSTSNQSNQRKRDKAKTPIPKILVNHQANFNGILPNTERKNVKRDIIEPIQTQDDIQEYPYMGNCNNIGQENNLNNSRQNYHKENQRYEINKNKHLYKFGFRRCNSQQKNKT